MSAISVSVATEVTAMLAAASFSQAISPERSYANWDLPLQDGMGLRVDVVAVTTEQRSELDARKVLRYVIPIDIAVRKKFVAADIDNTTGRVNLASIDALCLLVEEIHELFMPQRLTAFASAVWEETRIVVCPLIKHLREHTQFTGIVRLLFTAHKDIA